MGKVLRVFKFGSVQFNQRHSSKASILQCSAFFMVQISHPYMTTGKTIALTRWTFVDKTVSLLFNMLSRSGTTEWLHFHFLLSCIGEGNGNPLQCSHLENSRDRGAWWAAISFSLPFHFHESEKWKWSCSVVSDSLQPHGLQLTRLLCPWDFPGKSTGVGHHCLLPSNLDWRSISHMITYMFQCYSLKSSHPCLLPQSPKVCFFTSVSLLPSCI